MWQDPALKEAITARIVAALSSPDLRAQLSENSKRLWRDPAYRAKFAPDHHQKMAKTLWSDPTVREQQRQKILRQWQDSSFKAAHAKGRKHEYAARLARNPEAMTELTAKAKEALCRHWQDKAYTRKVMRSKIAGYVSRLIAEHGRDNVTPDLYEAKRPANWVPNSGKALDYFRSFDELLEVASTHNHRVVSMRVLSEQEDVYDITVDEHHNFMLANGCVVHNSIDNDPAAAYRYTEARLTPAAETMLADIDKETVDFKPNFDETTEEPEVLPSAVPNMLINGASGIAVGMATNIAPHNLAEIVDGLVAMIDNGGITLDEMVKHVKGPDFPTGGLMSRGGIRQALETGRGSIKLRGRVRFEERNNRQSIVVTEIPYQINKTTLIQTAASLVRLKKIEDISNIRDESDRQGMRIVFELKRGAHAELVLNQLYKYTQLQTTFSVNNLAIVGRSPKVLSLLETLKLFLDHRAEVVRRRTKYELRKAQERAHILEGYLIALDRMDEVIALIRASKDGPEARTGLQGEFGLTDAQAQAVLDMRLQRLTGLEREKVQAEYRELMEQIAYLQTILNDEQQLWRVIKGELKEVKKRFGDPRRTQISDLESDISKEDLIAEEEMVVTLTKGGYIKRTALTSYRAQSRGGRGVSAQKQKEDDFNSLMIVGNTHDYLLFFTDRGRVYREKIYDLPEAERAARGNHLRNILPLEGDESVQTVLSVADFDRDGYFVFATRQGMVKKTAIREYGNINASGLIAINLMDGDELMAVRVTSGRSHVVLATKGGQSLRFEESEVRDTGRATQGVRGIKVRRGDVLVSMTVVDEG
ncbi:MAG: intein-containing DNA gyrase subunit A, partial [Deinococcota bacterium]|nr:intein-containing DNA gyrase subunit A [Deinococcota bacterium]